MTPRRVLLSDGSGVSSAQVARLLGEDGHHVEVLDSGGALLTRSIRWVRAVHAVPPFGADPFAWLNAALQVLERGGFDALLATQEQVAVLALEAHRVRDLGVGLAVPDFTALARVQDKAEAWRTLRELGLPHPVTKLVAKPEDLLTQVDLPGYVKTRIGTGSRGVRLVRDRADLVRVAVEFAGEADHGGILVQERLDGPLVMVQSVFDRGRLVAWHAALRVREGVGGAALVKEGVDLPAVAEHLAVLGSDLGWHGALSADAVLTPDGPAYIDLNPRLVEPGNARRCGTDLTGALLRVSLGESPVPQPNRFGQRTHQLLLALLTAASRGRAAVLGELASVALRRGGAEELTPPWRDRWAAVLLAKATALLLANPKRARLLADGTVGDYALTADGWRRLCEVHGNHNDPADPADPADRADPVGPADPTDPVDPADPADPAAADNPAAAPAANLAADPVEYSPCAGTLDHPPPDRADHPR
ncbi:hypothetical protein [Saccharothrix xinjiangensis]|uniref:ATP-grasp domain-containing protein n=1 Tax=Saccharothrix xinjiangensis TaxID=204798 RepID=A0ABV9Y0B9_9PSEU